MVIVLLCIIIFGLGCILDAMEKDALAKSAKKKG
jgi:hypothetical protein